VRPRVRPCSRKRVEGQPVRASCRTTWATTRSPHSGSGAPVTTTSGHRGVGRQHGLDHGGAHVDPARDHDVGEPLDPHEPVVLVEEAGVAGAPPAVGGEPGRGGVGVPQVAGCDHLSAHEDLSGRGVDPQLPPGEAVSRRGRSPLPSRSAVGRGDGGTGGPGVVEEAGGTGPPPTRMWRNRAVEGRVDPQEPAQHRRDERHERAAPRRPAAATTSGSKRGIASSPWPPAAARATMARPAIRRERHAGSQASPGSAPRTVLTARAHAPIDPWVCTTSLGSAEVPDVAMSAAVPEGTGRAPGHGARPSCRRPAAGRRASSRA